MKKLLVFCMILLMTISFTSCSNPFVKGVEYDDYPHKDVPIYDDAVVFYCEGDDDEWELGYGTEDDIEDLAEFYADEFDSDDYRIINLVDTEKREYYCEGVVDEKLHFVIQAKKAKKEAKDYYDYVVKIDIEAVNEDDED